MTAIRDWIIAGLGIALLCLAALAGLQTLRLANAQRETALLQSRWDQDRRAAEEGARLASENHRREEQRRIAEQRKTEDEARTQAAAAQLDATAAGVALERLRGRLAASHRAAAAGHPGAARCSPPAEPSADLPIHLLERLGGAAGQLAIYADNARIAGEACERAHDTLTVH